MNAMTRTPPMGMLYTLGWLFFRCLFATYFRWHYFNPERVPRKGPVILASNHASFLDPPLAGAPLHRPLAFMARDTLFRFPILGRVLRAWNAIPVDREGGGASGLRQILSALESGHAIIVFPEGTRTRDGHLQKARSGIGLIILKSEAPVVPVRVFGTFAAYGRTARFPRPCPVSVKYGKPLHFEEQRQEAQTCTKARLKELYQETTAELMAAIGNLQPFEEVEEFAGIGR